MEKHLPYHERIAKRLGLPTFLPGDHVFDFFGGQSAHVEIDYTWLAIIKDPPHEDQLVAVSKTGSLVAVQLLVHEVEADVENSTIAEISQDGVYKRITRPDFQVSHHELSEGAGSTFELYFHSEFLDTYMAFTKDVEGPCAEVKVAIIEMAKDIAYRSGKPKLIEASKRLS